MKLKTSQWIAIAVSVLFVAVIFLFADTKKPLATKPSDESSHNTPGQQPQQQGEGDGHEHASFDWDEYLSKVKANIASQDTLRLIENWEKDPSETNLHSLINLYHLRGESVVEAHYSLQLGLIRKDDLLVRAGDLFSATAAISEGEELRHYLMDQSVESYKAASLQDSTVPLKLKLASAYMDQGTAPMQGVSILLGVVNENPQNADAQFLLGKFGIVSRQFDKAIVRLEKVVSLRPQNYDAVFLLAVAYSGKGDNAKAIELLDKCSRMVTKPELKEKIEEYKKSLSKGA